jgi:hypothetical protein
MGKRRRGVIRELREFLRIVRAGNFNPTANLELTESWGRGGLRGGGILTADFFASKFELRNPK